MNFYIILAICAVVIFIVLHIVAKLTKMKNITEILIMLAISLLCICCKVIYSYVFGLLTRFEWMDISIFLIFAVYLLIETLKQDKTHRSGDG